MSAEAFSIDGRPERAARLGFLGELVEAGDGGGALSLARALRLGGQPLACASDVP